MQFFLQKILAHWHFYLFFIIMFLSLAAILIKENLFQKLFALSIFQTNIILLFLAVGFNKKAQVPLIEEIAIGDLIIHSLKEYNNPLPHVLMLTAIVVGLATFALGLAILLRHQYDNDL